MTQTQSLPAPTLSPRRGLPAWLGDYVGLVAVLGLLVLVFSFTSKGFWSQANFVTLANQVPATVICAVGMTYILIIAGIDLSVGSVLGLCGALIGVLMARGTGYHLPLAVALPAALALGLVCGVVNGAVSVGFGLPSFIVTLGMLEIARGSAHLITGSRTQYIGSAVDVVARTSFLHLSLPFWLALGTAALGQVVLARTVFGRYLVAIGTNEEAVRLSGIDPRPVKVAVFALTGLLVAVAAVIETSRFESADPNLGSGLELRVIAAVVVGGTSLMGGRGSVLGSLLGVLIMTVLDNGLATVGGHGVSDETKRLVTGCVIVAAVILDQYRQKLRGA